MYPEQSQQLAFLFSFSQHSGTVSRLWNPLLLTNNPSQSTAPEIFRGIRLDLAKGELPLLLHRRHGVGLISLASNLVRLVTSPLRSRTRANCVPVNAL